MSAVDSRRASSARPDPRTSVDALGLLAEAAEYLPASDSEATETESEFVGGHGTSSNGHSMSSDTEIEDSPVHSSPMDGGKRLAPVNRSPLISPQRLLRVAEYVAAGKSLEWASGRIGLHRGTIGDYLTHQCLRDRGRTLVGPDMAARIDALLALHPARKVNSRQMPSLSAQNLLSVAKHISSGMSISAAARVARLNPGTVLHYIRPTGLTEVGRAVTPESMWDTIDGFVAQGHCKSKTPLTGETLRKAALRVAAGESVVRAEKAVGVRRGTIGNHMTTKGLRPTGRALLGNVEAPEIDAMLAQRARDNMMTADRLWTIGSRVAAGETLTVAANDADVKRPTTNHYLTTRGLRPEGRALLGTKRAKQLDALFAARTANVSESGRQTLMTADLLWTIGSRVAAGETLAVAANDADVKRSTANFYLTTHGLRPKGRALLGKQRAEQLDALFAARTANVSGSGRQISVTPDMLLKVASAMSGPDGSTLAAAAENVRMNRTTISTYLRSGGLTEAGRKLVGKSIAREIDALLH